MSFNLNNKINNSFFDFMLHVFGSSYHYTNNFSILINILNMFEYINILFMILNIYRATSIDNGVLEQVLYYIGFFNVRLIVREHRP